MEIVNKEISFEDQKAIQIEILKFIHSFCQEHDINYFLVGGSLIGAIRHHGYIPWDDDVDIGLLRNDYTKLIEELEKEKCDRFKILCLENDRKYYLPYAKMVDTRTILQEDVYGVCPLGVGIDIFPFDYLNCSYEIARKELESDSFIEKMIHFRSIKLSTQRSMAKNLATIVLRVICPLSFRFKGIYRMKRLSKIMSFNQEKYVACLVGSYGAREVCDAQCFEKQIDAEFENMMLKVPIGYDKYLRSIYGDYMKLPPEEKRVTHHSNKAYWR